MSLRVADCPGLSAGMSKGRSSHLASAMPITAASATRGMADRDILDLDRGNPLTARFDDILRAVGDRHVAFRIERRDIAGIEPAFRIERARAFATEIAFGDCGSAHLQPPKALPSRGNSRSSSSTIFISTPKADGPASIL